MAAKDVVIGFQIIRFSEYRTIQLRRVSEAINPAQPNCGVEYVSENGTEKLNQ